MDKTSRSGDARGADKLVVCHDDVTALASPRFALRWKGKRGREREGSEGSKTRWRPARSGNVGIGAIRTIMVPGRLVALVLALALELAVL